MSCIQIANKVVSLKRLIWSILLTTWQLWDARSGTKNNLLYVRYVFCWQCISMISLEFVLTLSYSLCALLPVFVIRLSMCFSFWYHIYDYESSPTSAPLKLTMVRGTTEEDLMEISKSKTDGWENATAFIGNQPGGYKVSEIPCMLLGCTQTAI